MASSTRFNKPRRVSESYLTEPAPVALRGSTDQGPARAIVARVQIQTMQIIGENVVL